MIFFVFGRRKRLTLCNPAMQAELGSNPTCLHPGCTGHVQLWKFSTYCHLCFIPLIPMTDKDIVKCQLCGRAYERAVYALTVNKRNMAAKNKAKNQAAAAAAAKNSDIPMPHAEVLEGDKSEETPAKENQGLIATVEANNIV